MITEIRLWETILALLQMNNGLLFKSLWTGILQLNEAYNAQTCVACGMLSSMYSLVGVGGQTSLKTARYTLPDLQHISGSYNGSTLAFLTAY